MASAQLPNIDEKIYTWKNLKYTYGIQSVDNFCIFTSTFKILTNTIMHVLMSHSLTFNKNPATQIGTQVPGPLHNICIEKAFYKVNSHSHYIWCQIKSPLAYINTDK
jgi:hypothetical protein